MNSAIRYAAIAVALSQLATDPSTAHHSFGHFDMRTEAEELFEGVVKEWRLVNPHSFLVVTVTDEGGTRTDWTFEAAQVPQLIRRGITADTYRPGDVVRVMAGPQKDGEPFALVKWVGHADGSFTLPNQTNFNSGQEALDRWLAENQ